MKNTDGIHLPPDSSLYTRASKDIRSDTPKPVPQPASLQQWLAQQSQPVSLVVVRSSPSFDGKTLIEATILREHAQTPGLGSNLIQLLSPAKFSEGSLLQVLFRGGSAELVLPDTPGDRKQQLQLSLNYQLPRLMAMHAPSTPQATATTLSSVLPGNTLFSLLGALGTAVPTNHAQPAAPSVAHPRPTTTPPAPSGPLAALAPTNRTSELATLLMQHFSSSAPLLHASGHPPAHHASSHHSININHLNTAATKAEPAALTDAPKTQPVLGQALQPLLARSIGQPEATAAAVVINSDRPQLSPWLSSQPQALIAQLLAFKLSPELSGNNDLARLIKASLLTPTTATLNERADTAATDLWQQSNSPKLSQWLTQQLILGSQTMGMETPISLMFLPFFQQHWQHLPFTREPLTQQGKKKWRYRFFLNLPPLAEFCAQLEVADQELAICFWSTDTRTLRLLQQQSQSLNERLGQLGLEQLSVECQHGLPPKPSHTPEQGPTRGQQLDLHV